MSFTDSTSGANFQNLVSETLLPIVELTNGNQKLNSLIDTDVQYSFLIKKNISLIQK